MVKLTVSADGGAVTDGHLVLPGKLQVLTDGFAGVKLTVSAERGTVTDGQLVLPRLLGVLTDGWTVVPVTVVRLMVSVDRGTVTDGQLVLPRLLTVLTDGWTVRWLEGLVYMGVFPACLTDWRPVMDGLMMSLPDSDLTTLETESKELPASNSHKTFSFAAAIDNLVFNSRDCFAIDISSSCLINSCFSAKCLASANNAALFKDSLTRVDETVLLWELVYELLCFDDRDRCVRLLGWDACETLSSGFDKLSARASRYTQTRSCNCWRAVNLAWNQTSNSAMCAKLPAKILWYCSLVSTILSTYWFSSNDSWRTRSKSSAWTCSKYRWIWLAILFADFKACVHFPRSSPSWYSRPYSVIFNGRRDDMVECKSNVLNIQFQHKQTRLTYSISQEICTRFCCALLCCGYAIVHNEFTWSIYPYSSGLLCWHWGNR